MTSNDAKLLLPQLGFELVQTTFDGHVVFEKEVDNHVIRWSVFDGGFVSVSSAHVRWRLPTYPVSDQELFESLSEEEQMIFLFNLELI